MDSLAYSGRLVVALYEGYQQRHLDITINSHSSYHWGFCLTNTLNYPGILVVSHHFYQLSACADAACVLYIMLRMYLLLLHPIHPAYHLNTFRRYQIQPALLRSI